MCLNTAEFALSPIKVGVWPFRRTVWEGVGYKTIQVMQYGKYEEYLGISGCERESYCFNCWLSAKGIKTPISVDHVPYPNYQCAEYYPGFHIWLRYEDAKAYGNMSEWIFPTAVVSVKYRDVLGFGNNRVPGIKDRSYGPCVVTRQMYIPKQTVEFIK